MTVCCERIAEASRSRSEIENCGIGWNDRSNTSKVCLERQRQIYVDRRAVGSNVRHGPSRCSGLADERLDGRYMIGRRRHRLDLIRHSCSRVLELVVVQKA
jgi:hypothetical protein